MKKIVIGILACVVMLLSACGTQQPEPMESKTLSIPSAEEHKEERTASSISRPESSKRDTAQLKNHRTIWKDLHHLRKHKLKIPPRRLFRQSRPKHRIPPIRPKQLHRLFQKAQSPFQLRLQKWRRRPQWNPNLLQNLSRNKIRNTLLIKILISIFGSVMRRIMGKVWG